MRSGSLVCGLKRGSYAEEEGVRYFALLYQLHLAFHLISRALIGDSPSMKQLRFALWNNVFTYDIGLYDQHLWNRMEDFSTLLLDEMGTGKGSAASAIGCAGFIPFDPFSVKDICIMLNLGYLLSQFLVRL